MSAFATLAWEAVLDAVRRRIVVAIVLLSLLSLMMIDGCTSCASGGITVNGEDVALNQVAGGSGVVILMASGLWICVLAGILASDHLQQTLEDGSANLCLARPVARSTFAFARLFGALAVALGAGSLLMGSATLLLNMRSALPVAPALLASAEVAIGALGVAALAMALSLMLPRLATILVVGGSVATIATANLLSLVPRGEEPFTGILAWIDRLGPPLATSVIAALDPWIPTAGTGIDPTIQGLRLLVWAVIGCAALVVTFRRVELGR